MLGEKPAFAAEKRVAGDANESGAARRVVVIFSAAAALLVVTTMFVYWVGVRRAVAQEAMAKELLVLQKLDDFLSGMKDSETGQRGYLLTGEPGQQRDCGVAEG